MRKQAKILLRLYRFPGEVHPADAHPAGCCGRALTTPSRPRADGTSSLMGD